FVDHIIHFLSPHLLVPASSVQREGRMVNRRLLRFRRQPSLHSRPCGTKTLIGHGCRLHHCSCNFLPVIREQMLSAYSSLENRKFRLFFKAIEVVSAQGFEPWTY